MCFFSLHCLISPWPPETPPTLAFAGGAHRRGEERRFFLLWADGLGLKAGVSATALNDPNDPNNPGCYSLCWWDSASVGKEPEDGVFCWSFRCLRMLQFLDSNHTIESERCWWWSYEVSSRFWWTKYDKTHLFNFHILSKNLSSFLGSLVFETCIQGCSIWKVFASLQRWTKGEGFY